MLLYLPKVVSERSREGIRTQKNSKLPIFQNYFMRIMDLTIVMNNRHFKSRNIEKSHLHAKVKPSQILEKLEKI